jgi:hypothetical protein
MYDDWNKKKYDEKNKKDKKRMRCLGKKKYVDECKQNVYDCD